MAEQSTLPAARFTLQPSEQRLLAVLRLFRRENRRASTKEESLSKAKEIAEDWYLQLRGKFRAGEIKTEKIFSKASEQFLRDMTSSRKVSAAKAMSEASTADRPSAWCRFRPTRPFGNDVWQGSGIPLSPA